MNVLDPKRVAHAALRALFWVYYLCILPYALLACVELILMLSELIA